VLRSIGSGTNRAHQRLNAGRAITLCCTANSASSPRFTTTASLTAPGEPLSIDFGTNTLLMKPMKYSSVDSEAA
jgi:hypothetical protein